MFGRKRTAVGSVAPGAAAWPDATVPAGAAGNSDSGRYARLTRRNFRRRSPRTNHRLAETLGAGAPPSHRRRKRVHEVSAPTQRYPRRARHTARFAALVLGLLATALMGTAHPVAAAATSDPPGTEYVVGGSTDSIAVYAPGASGNAVPVRMISGAATGLSNPIGLVLDASGTLFVSNSGNNTITEYASGATGNAVPTVTISGAATGFNAPRGLALDGAGTLIVANYGGNTITEYAAGAGGNTPPIITIGGVNTGLSNPEGLILDATGNLYVSNPNTPSITIYAPGASGNAAPLRTISGAGTGLNTPAGMVIDSSGNLCVANYTGVFSVTEYAPGASGNAAPIRTISGAATGLSSPYGLVLDAVGNLDVSNDGTAITEYAPGATGNVPPIRTITGLVNPGGIAMSMAPTGTQVLTVTVTAGSLSLAFANAADSFGTLNAGQLSSAVAAGTITETNSLADGSPWSTTVVAGDLTSGGRTIPADRLSMDLTASSFACGALGCSNAAGATAPSTNAAFADNLTPQTLMNGTAAAQGDIAQDGVTFTLAVPWTATASATPYTGTITYTITG